MLKYFHCDFGALLTSVLTVLTLVVTVPEKPKPMFQKSMGTLPVSMLVFAQTVNASATVKTSTFAPLTFSAPLVFSMPASSLPASSSATLEAQEDSDAVLNRKYDSSREYDR